MGKFRQQYLASAIVPIGILVLIIAVIVAIGTTFINAYQGGDKDRIDRPELWIGLGILFGVMGLMTLLYRMPENSGILGKDVVIGSQGMWEDDLPPVDPSVIYGQPGTPADIGEGFTLYAQSGALARVIASLPGGVDYGRRFSGMIYANGIKNASKEMWIPVEAVTAVYPETKTAFLAIKGDEAEALGWTSPPEGMTRGQRKHVPASDLVK